ncbi:MAG: DNA repair protein RecN [Gammaproteobacteria bacterium]
MLTAISIKNLAVVESLSLELDQGLTALTGETGAGKSILIDALGLALGAKADKGMIRSGENKAEVSAVFNIAAISEAKAWLEEQALDDADDCIIRRVITRDNKNKAFINGSPVTLKTIQTLGNLLVEIHGQHAHQRLLKPAYQLTCLDQFANHEALLTNTSEAYQNWQATFKLYQQLSQSEHDRASKLELLQFQAKELAELDLKSGEAEEIDQQFKSLSNADALIKGCYSLSAALYEDDQDIHSQLSSIQNRLSQLIQMDEQLADNLEMIESSLINIQECSDSLRHYADSLENDSQSLNDIENRLLTQADAQLEQLEAELSELEQGYIKTAEKLHKSRISAAKSLQAQTIDLLKKLAMPDVQFAVQVQSKDMSQAGKTGLDAVSFQVSSNPGQPPGPLGKVASGGELSRISLAIEVATMSQVNVPTLIFDEVDVGIGGGTAEIVGRLLRQLGTNQQVLCVTHLPQVASQAHQHLNVIKTHGTDKTSTSITLLKPDERVQEIARMLGGVELTKQTLAHAREMLTTAGS